LGNSFCKVVEGLKYPIVIPLYFYVIEKQVVSIHDFTRP